jgi:hypothetical protein
MVYKQHKATQQRPSLILNVRKHKVLPLLLRSSNLGIFQRQVVVRCIRHLSMFSDRAISIYHIILESNKKRT